MENWGYSLWALIPILGVLGYGITKIIEASRKPRADAALTARVSELEARIAALEKTINDIP
ncbi:hypothetical protein QT381_12400 [Galbitalea sp. SE-J8]|uniref:hypothetical protein n=1 Tax=Galbitalea sp. SE-J8 TaxID=3054952 RepID=UPI00259D0376|nr:hypothetical protein [Galbitalea sp. SE-J8]MDM4763808.1 hypothetical protein [Galbitalea sp. SE-J8]